MMIISILTDNNRGGVERSLYIHETCATDTDNTRRTIKEVFEDVKATVLKCTLLPLREMR